MDTGHPPNATAVYFIVEEIFVPEISQLEKWSPGAWEVTTGSEVDLSYTRLCLTRGEVYIFLSFQLMFLNSDGLLLIRT